MKYSLTLSFSLFSFLDEKKFSAKSEKNEFSQSSLSRQSGNTSDSPVVRVYFFLVQASLAGPIKKSLKLVEEANCVHKWL